jgi:hypothetical protein
LDEIKRLKRKKYGIGGIREAAQEVALSGGVGAVYVAAEDIHLQLVRQRHQA